MNKSMEYVNIEPLIKLREHLKTLPSNYGNFHMEQFAVNRNNLALLPYQVPECGTSMCLLGHLPLVGYPGLEDEAWDLYCFRILNISRFSPVWEYLFAPLWPSDIQLALQRLDDIINRRTSTVTIKSGWTEYLIDCYNDYYES